MRATVDSEGRIRLPDELREESGLQPGTEVELRWCGDHLEAEPTAVDAIDWAHLIDDERERRMRETWGDRDHGQNLS